MTEPPSRPGPSPATVAARLGMLALVVVLTLLAIPEHRGIAAAWLALLVATTLPGLLAPRHEVIGPLGRLAEVVVTCMAAAALSALPGNTGIADSVLPYLSVPILAAALHHRMAESVVLLGFAAAVLAGAGLTDP